MKKKLQRLCGCEAYDNYALRSFEPLKYDPEKKYVDDFNRQNIIEMEAIAEDGFVGCFVKVDWEDNLFFSDTIDGFDEKPNHKDARFYEFILFCLSEDIQIYKHMDDPLFLYFYWGKLGLRDVLVTPNDFESQTFYQIFEGMTKGDVAFIESVLPDILEDEEQVRKCVFNNLEKYFFENAKRIININEEKNINVAIECAIEYMETDLIQTLFQNLKKLQYPIILSKKE